MSQSGLLPIYGVSLDLDEAWVDGRKFPSAESNAGVRPPLQQLWDTRLAPAGLNVVKFGVDVNDAKAQESARLANLCVWAKDRGIKLVPVLVGSKSGQPLAADYAARAKTFVATLISTLKRNKSANLPAYGQIAFYQLELPLNLAASHGKVEVGAAAEALRKAASGIRAAEIAGLSDAGLSPTQLMVPVSFDFELVKLGAIAGTDLKPETYGQAYEAMKAYLAKISDAPEVGMFGIEWYPGSISSDGLDRLSTLVRGLISDAPGKLLVVSTGFSTAFNPPADQSRFYALAFANLADIRGSEGVDFPFAGVLWNSATDSSQSTAPPPSEGTPAAMAKWDLNGKSSELVKLWREGTGDPDLAWWWKKTEGSFGFLGRNADASLAPKQAHEVLLELQGATAEVAADTGVTATAEQLENLQEAPAPAEAGAAAAGDPAAPGSPADPAATAASPAPAAAEETADGLKTTLNGMLSQLLTGILEKGSASLTGRLLGGAPPSGTGASPGASAEVAAADPSGETAVDPATGEAGDVAPIDPGTGMPADPAATPPVEADPGAGGAAAMADLRIEGPVAPPSDLQTGLPMALEVQIKNQGTAAALGATAYLVDPEGNAFAASEQTTIEPGGTATAAIAFTPPSAGAISGVKVQLFSDNEGNPGDNVVDLGTLTITDPPAGTVPAEDAGAPTEAEAPAPGEATDTAGATPAGPGGLRPRPRPGVPLDLAGVRPTIGVSPGLGRVVGISPKRTVVRPGMFNVGALTPGSSARFLESRSAASPAMQAGGPKGFEAGRPIPLIVAISNPFNRSFSNVSATLYVSGKPVATHRIGNVIAKQTRTVSFNEFTPSSAGRFPTEVRFEATGLGNRRLTATVGGEIIVLDSRTARAIARPTLTARGSAATPRGMSGLVPAVVVPPASSAAASRPTGRPGLSPAGGGIRLAARPVGAASVSLGSDDIRLNPPQLPEGGRSSVDVNLVNRGTQAARGVVVAVSVDGRPARSVSVDVPAGERAVVSGFDEVTGTPGRHAIKVTARVGARTMEATKTVDVVRGVRPVARPAIGRLVRPVTRPVSTAGGTTRAEPAAPPSEAARADRPPSLRPAPVSSAGTQPQPRPVIAPPAAARPESVPPRAAPPQPPDEPPPSTGAGRPTRPAFGAPRATAMAPDLSVTTRDIVLEPRSPRENQDVIANVRVHNVGSADARDADLRVTVSVDGSAPVSQGRRLTVAANGESEQAFRFRVPRGSQLTVTAVVNHAGDGNAANATARVTVPIAAAPTDSRPALRPSTDTRPPTRPVVPTAPAARPRVATPRPRN
ncbi:MAG TPA: hypothetical protein VFF17_08750 [Thermoanaerobaculia bacterium]|nr:hypothetical protein [Thermoanaerobaculia bacterium]